MSGNKLASDNITANTYRQGHIDVLDGVRAVTVIIIVWYHIWQQSWIMPIYKNINLDWIPRNGSICVDMMILLSAFCLFLPYAKEMVYGTKTTTAKEFYIKRAARIMPSYYASVFICLLFFALPLGEYHSVNFMVKDVATHIFFVNNLWADTLIGTKVNVVLWTVAVEMQLYLLFPFLARQFQKRPVITYTLMTAAGLISCFLISLNTDVINLRLYVNYTPTFLCVFANGMLGAYAYINLTQHIKKKKALQLLFAVMAAAGAYLYRIMCSSYSRAVDGQKWQVENRFLLSLVFLMILMGVVMAQDIFHPLLGNRIMKFVAGISYNLYIWHRYIAVKLKEFRIPYWEGTVPPNMTNDRVWMWKYQTLCFVAAFIAAAAMTYLVEKPAAKMILKKFNSKNR